jgi:hypothetical protein
MSFVRVAISFVSFLQSPPSSLFHFSCSCCFLVVFVVVLSYQTRSSEASFILFAQSLYRLCLSTAMLRVKVFD